ISTSSTPSPATPARSSAARMAAAPSPGAGTSLKSPRNPPMAVRAAPTITTGSEVSMHPSCLNYENIRPGSEHCNRRPAGLRPSARPHAQRAVQPDGLSVDHLVFDDVADEGREFCGTPGALRKGSVPGQRKLHLWGKGSDHRSLKNAGRDGCNADADTGQLARGGKSEGCDAAFGRRVCGLANLPFKGSNGGGVDNDAALAILARLFRSDRF